MSASALSRALTGEALGTGLLVATVVGSGIMGERLAEGNAAIALLANTLATGAILAVLITMLAPVSGAHFNPAVTLVFALRGETGAVRAVLYGACQIAGALAGLVAAHLMFELAPLGTGHAARNGAGVWLGEVIATAALVLTILGVRRAQPAAVSAMVALVIAAGYWFTSSTAFANPAVTLARALTPSFSGIRPEDVPAFLAMQVLGALIALALGSWLFAEETEGRRATDRPVLKNAP